MRYERHPRRAPAPDDRGKVASYLAIKQLTRLVKADFAALPNEAVVWNAPEFEDLVRKTKQRDELDRLTLENVLGRICHCPRPQLWLRWHRQIAQGKMTFPQFIKRIVISRKS